MSTIIDTIKFLCKQKGITIKELEVQTELSNGTIGKWSSCSPKTDSLTKIADYFNCSVDYLLGRNVSDNLTTLYHPNNNELNSIINDLLSTDISNGDIEVIRAVLNKYKQ